MDDSTNTITGKNSNGSNVVPTNLQRSSNPMTQRQQELLSYHRVYQDNLLINFNRDEPFYNHNNDPEIIVRLEILKGHVRTYATTMADLAGAEVAIVALFQIMQNSTNAREGGGDGGRSRGRKRKNNNIDV